MTDSKAHPDQLLLLRQLPLFPDFEKGEYRRLTEHDYRKVSVYRDVEWADTELPKNGSKGKTLWRCKICGHEWIALYDNVARKTGCPECWVRNRNQLLTITTIEDYEVMEYETGYRWLDRIVLKGRDKSRWQCHKCGCIWASSLSNLKQGRRCPECRYKTIGDKTRLSAEDYHTVAHEKGAKWHGESVPKTAKTLTIWQCAKGHICERNYNQMKKSDYGCPKCGVEARVARTRLNREDYVNGALDRGIHWIGDKLPKNNHEKTLWQCPEDHTWEAPRHDVVGSESGCPYCQYRINGHNTSKQQRELAEMLDGEMNVRYGLRNTIDIVIERDSHNIAIEYDGWYWHGTEEMQERDAKRMLQIMTAGYKFIRICSALLLPSQAQLTAAIASAIDNGYAEVILEDWGIGNTFRE